MASLACTQNMSERESKVFAKHPVGQAFEQNLEILHATDNFAK
jgi:hypothetical protein